MSTSHFVYVGPYLVTTHNVKVRPLDALVDIGSERLYPACYDELRHLVQWLPNVHVPGLVGAIDTHYDCGKSNREIEGVDIHLECRIFEKFFHNDILAVERVHGQAVTCWGVIFYSM